MFCESADMFDRQPLRERVVEEIISRIASGLYPRGSRLPAERKLSEEFNVNRGTLRKGLQELKRLGVLEIRRGSGAYVKGLAKTRIPSAYRPMEYDDSVSLEDIIIARKAIELPAIRLACGKKMSSRANRLGKLLDGMEGHADDLPRFIDFDMQFHRTVVCMSGNKILLTAFDAIHKYHRFSQVFTSYGPDEMKRTIRQHTKILDAIRAGKSVAATKALTRHLGGMAKYTR